MKLNAFLLEKNLLKMVTLVISDVKTRIDENKNFTILNDIKKYMLIEPKHQPLWYQLGVM